MLRLANLLHVHDQVLLRDGLERSMAFNRGRHRFVISAQRKHVVSNYAVEPALQGVLLRSWLEIVPLSGS